MAEVAPLRDPRGAQPAGRVSQSHVFTFDRPGAWPCGQHGQKGNQKKTNGISIGKSPLNGISAVVYLLGFGSYQSGGGIKFMSE